MSSTPPQGGTLFVEPLEARIAPTGMYALAGNPAAASDPHYITYTTSNSGTALHFVPASQYGINTPNLYAIQLTGDGSTQADGVTSTGDELVIFNSVTGFNLTVPTVQANKGPVVAFFLNSPNQHGTTNEIAGQVYADELVGVSTGKKAILTINDNVYGDIVTNLLNGGATVSLNSVGKPSQGINGLTMSGNVYGNILAGGNVKNVDIVGSVYNVLAGTATNGVPFNFSGNSTTPTGTIAEAAPQVGHHGANINQLTINALQPSSTVGKPGGRIQAGDGGATGVGGAVTNVRIEADTNAFEIYSGAGGDGALGTLGGTGGIIGQIIVRGAGGTTPNSQILIQAGHGGNNAVARGGNGGTVSEVAVGYDDDFDFDNNVGTVSADLLMQNVTIVGGAGGAGIKGGNGGAVSDAFINGFIPDDGVINADGSRNAEIQVSGGAGGVALATDHGKGGHGGNIETVDAENQDVQAAGLLSSILIQGGTGGASKGGGNVDDLTLLGTILTVTGGDGGSGINKGGGGGSLSAISVANLTNLFTSQLILNAGTGGDGSAGHGGDGGNISNVELADSELALLVINSGVHGNGGRGGNGVGGAGGSVGEGETAGINLLDTDPSGSIGTVAVRAGSGGDGTAGGGAGGGMDTFQLLGVDFTYALAAGAGGNSIGAQGQGGAGGSLAAIGITNIPAEPTAVANATLFPASAVAGAGGNGSGAGGLGGAGGGLASVNLGAVYNVTMTAGNAGNGPSGAGAGGSFNGAAANSLQGAVTATAGAGGQSSGGASDGGSITGFIAASQNTISIVAGNGGSGGAGGSITSCGDTVNTLTQLPNTGNLTITAGNGASLNGIAGAGGSISTFTGYVADAGFTALTAGNGGDGAGATASGHGGGIDTIKLTGTANVDAATTQVVTFDGGNAGVASAAARGRAGGSVSNVSMYNLDAGTIVQHVAAGDGASGLKKGGAGGNVTEVHVGLPNDPGSPSDIGIRSGVAYGYAIGGAGGIFAGVGGLGSKSNGPNGDVTGITASAIASIVAGKETPQLCSDVDEIFLEGLVAPTANSAGEFTNFFTANLVGSIYNDGNGPTAPGATIYKQGDGLVAAANLLTTTNFADRNFTPEATLTNQGNDLVLADYVEQNIALGLNPVIVHDPAPAYLG